MSEYTTELRYICEEKAGLMKSVGENDVERVITQSRREIFNFEYPIFSDEYKETLEKKILRHFYTREIGFETYGLWHLKLQTKMVEIMPYYNKLYESELLEHSPLEDTNYYEDEMGNLVSSGSTTDNAVGSKTSNGTGRSTMTGTVTDAGTHQDVTVDRFHDTPQGALTDLSESQYLTNVRQINNSGNDGNTKTYNTGNDTSSNDTTNTSLSDMKTSSTNSQNTITKHIHGKRNQESYNKLLKDYRANLLNIDLKVIGELEDLFIQLW